MASQVTLAIVGGTGFERLAHFEDKELVSLDTPFGAPSNAIVIGNLFGKRVCFLSRHGDGHVIPPHLINYRANMHALKQLGAEQVIAINAVGGISPLMGPRHICIPNQLIDYTWGREHTYAVGDGAPVNHIDFTCPYDKQIRRRLISAAESVDMDFSPVGTYGCTQGPRLETAAEIDRLDRDGCDIVGMTGMPEAALAKELALQYACIALIVNRAAGRGTREITLDEINANLEKGANNIYYLIREYLAAQ